MVLAEVSIKNNNFYSDSDSVNAKLSPNNHQFAKISFHRNNIIERNDVNGIFTTVGRLVDCN